MKVHAWVWDMISIQDFAVFWVLLLSLSFQNKCSGEVNVNGVEMSEDFVIDTTQRYLCNAV